MGSGDKRVGAVVGAVTPLAIAISMFLLDAVLGKYSTVASKIMTCAFLCGTSTVLYALHYVFKDLRFRAYARAWSSPFLALGHGVEEHESAWSRIGDEVIPLVVAYICGYALSIMLAHITNIIIFTLGFIYFIFMRLFIKWLVALFSKYIPDYYRPRYLLLYGTVGGVVLSVVGLGLTLLYILLFGA